MGNSQSPFKAIRVVPTLSTAAYADGDVFFNPTEIPGAVRGSCGCALLHAITIVNEDQVEHDHDLIFMRIANSLGTINDVVSWSDATIKASQVTGMVKIDASLVSTNLVANTVITLGMGIGLTHPTLPQMIQSDADSTSVYVAAVSRGGTPTCAADDYEYIFHIQQY